ncbi:MAG: NUDIX domain-containing protein [Patescibacteria group bacterium]
MEQRGTPAVAQQSFTLEIVVTDGHERRFLRTSDSANVLIYLRDRQQILLVSQCREAMVRPGNANGRITESTAGRFDRDESVRQLLAHEAGEEVGVTIDPNSITLLNQCTALALSAGCLTERAWLGYVEITNDQLEQAERAFGLAEEGERITRVFLPVSELENYVCEDVRVFALLQWFLRNKVDKR